MRTTRLARSRARLAGALALAVALPGAAGLSAVAAPSTTTTATTTATATTTVYYPDRPGWTVTNIHYGVDGAAWTSVPGVPMTDACAGWLTAEIGLGAASGAQLTFNDGAGTWDNNRGANYRAGAGTVVVRDGVLTTGTSPCGTDPTDPTGPTDPTEPTATIYYATSWAAPKIHYQVGSGAWTSVPGTPMTAACAGWFAHTIDLGQASGGQVVFNDGAGRWDNDGGGNYRYAAGPQTVSGGVLAPIAGSPCGPDVPEEPDTQAPSVPSRLVATADGVRVTVSWDAATDDTGVTGYTLTRTGGAGTVTRDVTTASATDVGLLERTAYTYTVTAVDAAGNRSAASAPVAVTTGSKPVVEPGTTGEPLGGDPREDAIYFVMTARFNDGVSENNRGGSQHVKSGNAANDDPMFRGDFQGLVDKLDYVKGLGFSAIWITPVVLNRSDYDFHGYHGWDFFRVDPRLETPGASYQELIDAAHAKGIKIYQDVVYNHSSRWGAKGLFVPTVWGARDGQWDWMYSAKEEGREYDPLEENDGNDPTLTAAQNALAKGRTYNGDLWSTTAPAGSTCTGFGTPTQHKSPEGFPIYGCQWPSPTSGMFPKSAYHQCWIGNWEGKDAQDCWLHDDLADLNTENAEVQQYLIDAYNRYIDMGVDGFRVDTAVHVPRVMWNRHFLPAIQEHAVATHGEKGKDFYVFGEVAAFVNDKWNRGSVNHSAQFYTWKERKEYSLDDVVAAAEQFQYENLLGTGNQPTSDNAFLGGADGNTYHAPDHSTFSGMNVIDMRMHMNFGDAGNAYHNGKDSDDSYNDATYNVVYVDSHDYGPNKSTVRYAGGTDAWAENMSLMWTFRGIPTLYYGSEIEFQAGKPIDCGPTCPLATTGRAYYGDHLAGDVVASDFGVVESASGAVAQTLQKPLVQHVQRLNQIRRAVPALQKGQYSTVGVQGNMAYKRRFTEGAVDSFVLVTVTDAATFSRVPNGTYVDAVTGDRKVVTTGTLTVPAPGKGNLRAYVLDLPGNPAPGKVGQAGPYLK
ncbi:MAG: alpha-amylase [Cellulosimicrobium sp.]|jgi:glycosidase|nr:alpha-amylase [Cellulosimicrobium sp.]